LDPESQPDRDRLLGICLIALLGWGEAGRPPDWNNFGQLMDDVEVVKNGARRNKSDREICRILIEDKHGRFDGRYKDTTTEALRHRVRNLKDLGDN
jgi:hypothetical protein